MLREKRASVTVDLLKKFIPVSFTVGKQQITLVWVRIIVICQAVMVSTDLATMRSRLIVGLDGGSKSEEVKKMPTMHGFVRCPPSRIVGLCQ